MSWQQPPLRPARAPWQRLRSMPPSLQLNSSRCVRELLFLQRSTFPGRGLLTACFPVAQTLRAGGGPATGSLAAQPAQGMVGSPLPTRVFRV